MGWISRKPLVSGRGSTFFLTSLLMELIKRDKKIPRLQKTRRPKTSVLGHPEQPSPELHTLVTRANSLL